MESQAWAQILEGLAARDVATCVAAAERVHAEASLADIPKLLELLRDGADFFAREAAAWPLAELAGPEHLRPLLVAYQRGFEEGHDNDGFAGALLEIPALFPSEARAALLDLVGTTEGKMREHAQWLLTFCKEQSQDG